MRPDPASISSRREFARALTDLREIAGLTVRDAAKQARISASTAGGYFSGRHLPPVTPHHVLADLLGTCGVDDAAEVESWYEALRRVRRVPQTREESTPYKGLASFQIEDAEWFFGRDRLVAQVRSVLAGRPAGGVVVVVVGPSGSGKSSVLRAGVLAGLGRQPYALTTPGAHPQQAIAQALSGLGSGGVLVVDQFEEVFTAAVTDPERAAAIETLAEAARSGSTVLLALRADFYDRAMRHPVLLGALREATVLVGPMTGDELRSAIVEPARRAGIEIEDGLVELLLRDHEPGALPLLSHALLSTLTQGRGRALSVADYLATGGIHGAVAESAERAYLALDPAAAALARSLFLRLVAVGEDGVVTRRRLPATEETAEAEAVLDAFVDRRLVTADLDGYELSHEALIAAWPRLAGWIETDRDWLRAHRQLEEAAREWEGSQRDPATLFRGSRLAGAREWAAGSHGSELTSSQQAFIAAGGALEEADRLRERRAAHRLRRLVGGLVALLVLALALGGASWRFSRQAAVERDLALSRQVAAASAKVRPADTSLAGQLAVQAYRTSPTAEARSAVLDALTAPLATRLAAPPGAVQAVSVTADGAVLAAAGEGGIRLWSLAGTPRVLADLDSDSGATFFALAVGPPGRTLYAGGGDSTVHRWDLTDASAPRELEALTVPTGTIYSLAVDRAGTRLAAACSDGSVRLWDLTGAEGPRALAPLAAVDPVRQEVQPAQAVSFSPDGALLAAGGANATLRVWPVNPVTRAVGPARTAPADRFAAPDAKVLSVAFDPSSRRLASGTRDGQVRLWAVAPSGAVAVDGDPLPGPTSWVNGLVFSPDGATLAAAGSDNLIWRFDLAARQALPTYPVPAPGTAVAYTSAGKTLVSASVDATVHLWPSQGPKVSGLERSYYSVRFAADGRRACTATSGDQAAVVDTADPARPVLAASAFGTLAGELEKLDGTCAISPDGTLVALGANTGSVMLWDVRSPSAPRQLGPELAGEEETVQYVAFSPDGRTLAAAGNDGLVRVWDVTDPRSPRSVAELDEASNYVFALSFSADSRWLAAGNAAHTVWLYDLAPVAAGGAPVPVGPALIGPTGYVYAVAISPDGRTVAAGGGDKAVWMWDVSDPAAPQALPTLTGPTEMVNALAFSPDGRTLAAGNGDDTVWIWDASAPGAVRHRATLTGSGSEVLALAWHPGGKVLGAGTTRGLVFWTTDADAAAREICTRAGEVITPAEWNLYLPGRPYAPSCS